MGTIMIYRRNKYSPKYYCIIIFNTYFCVYIHYFVDQYYIYEDDLRNPNGSISDIIMWSNFIEEINLYDKLVIELHLQTSTIIILYVTFF